MLQQERDCVRELVRRVAALASTPAMAAIRARWRDVNALRRPDRAPVWCRPVGCWGEILPPASLVCTDPWLRSLELQFRQVLYKHDVGDDSPVEPAYTVSAVFRSDPANRWGLDVRHTRPEAAGGAWAYDPPLVHDADFARLQVPRFTVDRTATEERYQRVAELLGDIMPVQVAASPPLGATLGTAAADLRGLATMMLDMAEAPERLHRLMRVLCDGTHSALDAAEASGLLQPNNTGPMTCSDPLVPAGTPGPVTCRHLWCMANSQEFDQVSPWMWEEFLLQYQRELFTRFGLVGYGCCEDLTHKLDGVLSIPNLRIFVCSAWTDLQRVMRAVGDRYCIMWRQKASDVVLPDDDRRIRQDLEEGARMLQGCRYQIVLRELQTLAGHLDRLHVWTACAQEAAARYA